MQTKTQISVRFVVANPKGVDDADRILMLPLTPSLA